MPAKAIRFDDGAAYEEFMGRWSQLAGEIFLPWLDLPRGLRWLDVGCGNGAFTEMIAARCAPSAIAGIDPSPGQLAFARERPGLGSAALEEGDATALPHADASFDVAVMALVLFFVPDPARGVAEMRRVIRPGGTVAAYTWDIFGGGFPIASMQSEMRALGMNPVLPPSSEASRPEALRALWTQAGLVDIEVREIAVSRSFDSFEHYWAASMKAPTLGASLAAKPPAVVDALRSRMAAKLAPDTSGRITINARANAIKGRSPK